MEYAKNPVVAVATDIEFSIGAQIVLDKATLTIHKGEKIGLVGRNGSGKSSFLKILAGVYQFYSGEIDIRKGVAVGFLSQEFTLDETQTVYQNILDGAQHIVKLLDEYKSLPATSARHHELETRIMAVDGWNLEKRIDELIEMLDAPPRDSSVAILSGGEKRRVALCRALVAKPELLILDEPTNHLDMDAIDWLEQFVIDYSGACIFVTHDRYFLDKVSTRIIELANGIFYSHAGTYQDYLENKATRIEIDQNTEERRQKFLEQEYEWVKRGPKARTTKSKHRIDRYHELKNADGAEENPQIDLILPPAPYLGKKIVDLFYVSMEYPGKPLFEDFVFRFQKGMKIGVVGGNGLGKTTLLKIILGEIKPTRGNVDIGKSTQFNYVDQAKMLLDDEKTVFEEVGEGFDFVKLGDEKVNLWTYLKRFLFEDERIKTLVKKLSGGERSRVILAKILKHGGNFIILDEPTNDLDLETLRILEEALIDFEGVVLVVSHDRYFLNRVCTGILAFEGDGKIHYSVGDYDYYEKKKKERLTEKKKREKSAEKEKKAKEKPKPQTPKVRKLSYHEKKELETIEERIMDAEAEVERIETIFSSPNFYDEYDGEDVQELTEQLEAARQKAEELYDRWEELERIKSGIV